MKKLFLLSLAVLTLTGFCFSIQPETAEDSFIAAGDTSEDIEPDFLYYYI